MRALWLAGLVFIFLALPVLAERPEKISLKGSFVDLNDNSLENVRVSVDTRIEGIKEIYTDETGAFEFKDINFHRSIDSIALTANHECTEQKTIHVSWSDNFNKIQIDEYLFDDPEQGTLRSEEELFEFSEDPNIDLGKIELYPFNRVFIDSDEKVGFEVFYRSKYTDTEDLGGLGNSGYKKDHGLFHAVPINYDVKVVLTNEDGESWELPIRIQEKCKAVKIIKRNDKLTSEICESVDCPPLTFFQKIVRWFYGVF